MDTQRSLWDMFGVHVSFFTPLDSRESKLTEEYLEQEPFIIKILPSVLVNLRLLGDKQIWEH